MTRDQFITEMMGEKWEVVTEEYACHCDVFDGEEPDECVLDSCEYSENDCIYARKGMDKKTCEYWKPVKLHVSNPNFTTPADAYRLMQFVMGAEWWSDFYRFAIKEWIKTHKPDDKSEELFAAYLVKWLFSDPDRFSYLVAEYRGWQHD